MREHILSNRTFWISIDYDGAVVLSGNQPSQLMCTNGRWCATTTEPREYSFFEDSAFLDTDELYKFMILAGIVDTSKKEQQWSYTFTDEDIRRYNGWKSL